MMTTSMATAKSMDDIVALCKRRGFVFPASEIYGGINGFWDFGPLGVELKNKLRDAWWQAMVRCPPTGPDGTPLVIVGLDSAIVQNPRVWEASGHVEGFSDPMVDCRGCKSRFRSDELATTDQPQRTFDELDPKERSAFACPQCGQKGQLTEPRDFNLMFESYAGAVKDAASKIYLRPETAQGMFVNYKNVMDTMRVKVPFGIAQTGKAFRNEVTPRNFIYRSREFEQMEMEWFCPPEDAGSWFEFWQEQRMGWWRSVGLSEQNLQIRPHGTDELSHYARGGVGTVDIEYRFPFTAPGFAELEGIAHRTDFDLRAHEQRARTKLHYFDQERNLRYLPHVVEPAAGLTRGSLAIICEAFTADPSRPSKVFMKFHPRLAPIQAAIFPLVAKSGMPEVAEKLYRELRDRFACQFDVKQSIGKRYARMDEAGTPYCFTIDGQTLEDQSVTVRDRDSAGQERIALDAVDAFLGERIDG